MKWLLLVLLLFIGGCSVVVTPMPVVFQFDSACSWEELVPGEVRLQIENEEFVIIGTDATEDEIIALKDNECVVRFGRPSQLKGIIADIQADLDNSSVKNIKRMRKSVREDVPDRDDLVRNLENLHPNETWPGAVIAPYQLYVTPEADAVVDLANELDGISEIYSEGLSWIWVSEQVLNGVDELWLMPEEFLENTPYYVSNPAPGYVVSDCEDQANALVSLLIADGYDVENVRVVLGSVDFEGYVGGHAWVEVQENGRWFAVEPTMGPYYDEDLGIVVDSVPVNYDYFKYHTYPAEEIWFYYNNEYFLDISDMRGNAPPSWRQSAASWLEEDLTGFEGRR
tara:strand:+ start:1575 stop:2594 length:1020 start_codon:yes stop_codon:yes gene_type:complete